MKFGHLILRNIFKFVATRCQIVRLKCAKFNFGWDSVPDHTGGAYSALPRPSSWILRGLLPREVREGVENERVRGEIKAGNDR